MKGRKHAAALVTGAGRRIGRAIAIALARDGFDVAVHYRNSAADAASVSRFITSQGRECQTFQADLLDVGAAASLVPHVVQRFPRLEFLVNCASIFIDSGLGKEDLLSLDQHWGIHVRAPWILTSEFARLVGKGNVVNFVDTRVADMPRNLGAYTLSKKALDELTRLQAVRFAPKVRVNAIAPGLILPPEGMALSYLKQRARSVPLNKIGKLENIVQAVRYLRDNDFVTGQTLYIDGGAHLGGVLH